MMNKLTMHKFKQKIDFTKNAFAINQNKTKKHELRLKKRAKKKKKTYE